MVDIVVIVDNGQDQARMDCRKEFSSEHSHSHHPHYLTSH